MQDAERRELLLHCARISLTQARQRRLSPRHCRQPGYIADLIDSAARDTREVASMSITPAAPAQLELFA